MKSTNYDWIISGLRLKEHYYLEFTTQNDKVSESKTLYDHTTQYLF